MKNNTEQCLNHLISQWFAAGESLNSHAYAQLFAENGQLSIGNFPTATGREAIAISAQTVFNLIKKLEHEVDVFWEFDHTTIIEGQAYYILKNEDQVKIPIAAIVQLNSAHTLIEKARVYLDPSPLLSTVGI